MRRQTDKNALSQRLRANSLSVVPPEFGAADRPALGPCNGGYRRPISWPELPDAFRGDLRKPRTVRLLSGPGPRVLLPVTACRCIVECIVSPKPPAVKGFRLSGP